MSAEKEPKRYSEMTSEELAEATKEFDEEFVAERAKPMASDMKARWERAKAKSVGEEDGGIEQITVRVEKTLLDRCTILAKKKRLSRDALVSRGLRALLAAEGE